MFACEAMFGRERGQQVHQLVEESISGPCPCLAGRPCPISGATPGEVIALPPLSRREEVTRRFHERFARERDERDAI